MFGIRLLLIMSASSSAETCSTCMRVDAAKKISWSTSRLGNISQRLMPFHGDTHAPSRECTPIYHISVLFVDVYLARRRIDPL
jgi:hypothetical protein